MKNALIFLIETFSQLYLLILLLRFWLPLLRANFRNPVAQGILRYTSPLIVPVRRFVPPIRQIDTATVLVALLIQLAATFLILLVDRGLDAIDAMMTSFLPLLVSALFELASLSIVMFIVAIILRVIFGLFGRYFGPLSDILSDLTEPLMRPVRRFIPPIGVIDLSAYIVIVLLIALNMILADLTPRF